MISSRPRAPLGAAATLLALPCFVACGSSGSTPTCGPRAEQVAVADELFCVFGPEDLAVMGGAADCPALAPVEVHAGGAVVCRAAGASTSPADLPAELCASLPAGSCTSTIDAGPADSGAPDSGAPPDADLADADAGTDVDGDGPDAGGDGCPPLEDRPVFEVRGERTRDETWTCAARYVLDGRVVVTGGATLTLQAGTVVEANAASRLVVATDGRLDAVGTPTAPIVLSSSRPVGSRQSSDWRGVTLLGTAPVSSASGTFAFDDDPTMTCGGSDERHDCGRLRYVRIEFAGGNRGGALEVGACGGATTLDHLQIHGSGFYGIDAHGGSADLHHVVISNALEHAISWEEGWRGRIQFLVARSVLGADEAGLLYGFGGLSARRSHPVVFHATLFASGAGASARGVVVSGASDFELRDSLLYGSFAHVVDLRGVETFARAGVDPPGILVQSTMFFGRGGDPQSYTSVEADPDTFDEAAWLAEPAHLNRFGVDPMLAGPSRVPVPDLQPLAGSPAADCETPPDDGFFDVTASYCGAFAPGREDWTAGWTAYPVN